MNQYEIPEIITDELIISKFIKNNKLIATYSTLKWLNNHKGYYNYLINRFKDSESINETIYRIVNKLEKRPVCPICGKKLKYITFAYGFQKHCSVKCEMQDPQTFEKAKLNSISKYGVDHYSKTDEFKEKYKQTNLKKYGYDNPNKSKEVQNKRIQTCKEKYGVINVGQDEIIKQKIKNTHIQRHNCEHYTNSEKMKETQRNRYGGLLYTQTEQSKYRAKQLNEYKRLFGYYNSADWKLKQQEKSKKEYITKKKNNSFYSTKIEQQFKEYLEQNFPNDFEYQYKSELYPFNCDFYIKSLDLYIEIQGNWTHGDHPFDENNQEDIDKLNLWKSKNTKYYQNAINTWTNLDVRKRNIAKQNNLNYLEIFSININNIINILNNNITYDRN